MSQTVQYVAKSFIWGFIAKIIDSAVKFVSTPLLLVSFGKENFALIALATSINTYLNLLDLGLNTGAVKFFSNWINNREYTLIDSVARTSLSFYCAIGLVNILLLVGLSLFGLHLFSVTAEQEALLRQMLLILALFSLINWCTSVFIQLLTAHEDVYYIQKINLIKSLLLIAVIGSTIFFSLDLVTYFLLSTAVNSLLGIPLYLKAKRHCLISSLIPTVDWVHFKPVFRYSLSIIAIGIFQVSANTLRPIVLSIFSKEGIAIVTDYRIMETIAVFIISIGGIFGSIFLPKTSRLLAERDTKKIEAFAYESTLYTSIICILLCLPVILCAKEIIFLYVGNQYIHLIKWLITWVSIILLFLHSTPVNSLLLATGKIRFLVYTTAFSSISSLLLNAILCQYLNVGSAVIGYAFYIIFQMSVYYLYVNHKVLGLNSLRIFKSFIVPVLLSIFALFIVQLFPIYFPNLFLSILVKCSLWFILFTGTLILFKIISIRLIYSLLINKNSAA